MCLISIIHVPNVLVQCFNNEKHFVMKTATSSPYLFYYYHTVEATIQQCDHVVSVLYGLLRTSLCP